MVDEVSEVRNFTRQEIQPAPRFLKGKETDYFLGVCQREDDLVMILNLEKILSTDEKIDLEQIQSDLKERSELS